nr:alcohol dehydrogenase catalytic domain-containing protein [Sporosarcina obsidiansis]
MGATVTNVEPGDHVVLSNPYCGECSQCLTGHQNLCERTVELNFGGKSKDGSNRIHQHNHQFLHFLVSRLSRHTPLQIKITWLKWIKMST